ncbi:homeobox-DDT domain protein RLT3 [Phoenix dactylifera]|uniref:Homeobox-DDT domain protein RLT3 n=1 Tax=Phoenix dactylifera TaxID=42345 RepID=A0A8B7D584_PHODC|nr:homeobox-DDT domain protein RLT3 [Phoenix dactylifera]XP_038987285.1 homeobox-DDT domain protein RLT3 [Phoenix dactylifera]XP_038987286.1 homeobox-DDT domain protein RLT3 [Phoenix dactylifera]
MGNDDNNAKKDNGTKKTQAQLQSLEKLYSDEKYPKQKAMEEYAISLNLTYNQIRTWFVERRRKEKKENEALSKLKSIESVEPESDQSNDNVFFADGRHVSQKDRHSAPIMHRANISGHSSNQLVRHKDSHKISGQHMKNSVAGRMHCAEKKHLVRLQVLFSQDYILKKVFRKDGPPLGVEFDPPPGNAFSYRTGSEKGQNLQSCYNSQRSLKKRKVLEFPLVDPITSHERNVPEKKCGLGKGLMTVWRATNSGSGKFPTGIDFVNGSAAWMLFKSNASFKKVMCQVSKRMQQRGQRQNTSWKKIKEKRKLPIRKRKVLCGKNVDQKKPHPTECKLSLDEPKSLEQSNALTVLVDDEELELRELQAGPNPLRCSAHLASSGRHGCPLCKDLLTRFPPQSVKMKLPFCIRPWDSSPELVKKLFKVLRFLYTHSVTIEVCPFTLDELAQAFHDKDSLLLGKIHVALLKLLLLDVEKEITAGFIRRAFKDCKFLGFLNFVREQELDVNFWSRSLNSLTWTEILRQVLVAAGYGSKQNTAKRQIFSKERNRMAKYGLCPRTLKGELFTLLSKQGTGGLKVSELARASQIVDLDLPNTKEDLEQLISSTLSSDITLFEKIGPSAYRLRVDPHVKGKEDLLSDTEDSGSVDDDSVDASSSNDDSEEINSAIHERWIVKYKARRKKTGQEVAKCTEIDESYSGEAWVLGLMEGEYSDLSIEEKLNALAALVDLVGAGSIVRPEEPIRVISVIPSTQSHGSGAKIKKSSTNNHLLSQASWEGPAHNVEETHSLPVSCPTDFSATFLKTTKQSSVNANEYHPSVSRTKNSEPMGEPGQVVHPLQSIYLGSDRRYNSYWLFLGPCTADDPGHRRVYFESSEDGHWEVIDTSQALHTLRSVLDGRGTREARLCASLEKRETFLCQAMDEYMTDEIRIRQTRRSDPSDLDTNSGDGSSPISDIDNVTIPTESTENLLAASGAIVLEVGRGAEDKKQKWERLQAFDKWIWSSFYSSLNAVKYSKRSYMESLARCESCHDLYWRDEKHCKICHATFEIDFDLEERYAIHVATCREVEDTSGCPNHKVLPSQLQALKAAIHAIEMNMPDAALANTWTSSAHKLWVKRLRRTSSMPELLQVLVDFVGAINEEWLYECASSFGSNMALDDIIVYFQTMPQTTSAVALWMVKLDSLIAPYLERVQSKRRLTSMSQLRRSGACTR